MSTFYIGDIYTDVYILHRKERIRFSIYYMVPTSKCLDVGDHIFAVVYTTSYVRQIWVGAVYYTARTYIGHEDRSSVPPLYTPSLLPPLHPLSTLNIYALKKRCLTRFIYVLNYNYIEHKFSIICLKISQLFSWVQKVIN